MLTLIALGILREQSETNRHLRGDNSYTVNVVMTTLLVLVLLWPIMVPAAIIRYLETENTRLRTLRDAAALVIPTALLISLFFLGWQAYFAYGVIIGLITLVIGIAAMQRIENEENEKNEKASS